MIYGYARVSSATQLEGTSLDAQYASLIEAGCDQVFSEQFTGMSSDRPEFTRLLSVLEEGDTLVVTKLDRFARSSIDGITLVRELLEKGISVRVLNMGLIEDTPVGHLILTVMFAMAEFERDMIVERTTAGKRIAKSRPGYKEGRPVKEFSDEKIKKAQSLLEESGKSATAKYLGVTRSTVYKMIEDGRLIA